MTAAKNFADRVNGTFNMTNSLSDAKSAYDTGIKSLHGYTDSARNLIAQMALNDQANAHEIDMWNLQNAYNTPAAQMERFKEAGLNPMLAYTQGSNGNASSAPGTHVPNAKLTEDQDRLNKAAGILSMFQAVNGMVKDIFSTIEQSYDVGIKRNEKAWSDLDYAAAKSAVLGFGEGRNVPHHYGVSYIDENGNYRVGGQDLDLNNPNFSPLGFRVLDRLGVSSFVPKITSAEAGARYSESRTNYQNYYNEHILPLEEQFKQGKVSIQDLQKGMLEYQDKVLEMIPPEYRAILVPILQYIRPLINTSMRFQ